MAEVKKKVGRPPAKKKAVKEKIEIPKIYCSACNEPKKPENENNNDYRP